MPLERAWAQCIKRHESDVSIRRLVNSSAEVGFVIQQVNSIYLRDTPYLETKHDYQSTVAQ